VKIIIELEVQPLLGKADRNLLVSYAYALLPYPEVKSIQAHYDGDDHVFRLARKKPKRR